MSEDRKHRLFACACCRRIWHLFPDQANRELVAVVEEHPEGKFDDPELQAAIIASSARERQFSDEPAYWVAKCLGRGFYKMNAADSAFAVAAQAASLPGGEHGREAQAAIRRDIFGNRKSLLSIEPSLLTWNGGLIVQLARVAYDDRLLPSGHLDPDRLAVLADALEDAGWREQEVLAHLRQQGMVHVRGCFVIDALLGKS